MDNPENSKAQPYTIEELVGKLKEIQLHLEQNLTNLKQNLEEIYSNPKLCRSMENFRTETHAQASNLEKEIKRLQEDLKEVRNVLGLSAEENKSVGS